MLSNNAAVCIATPALSQRVHVHVIRDTPKLGVGAPSEHTALTSLVLLRCPRQRKPRGQPSLWVLCIVVNGLGSRGGLRVLPSRMSHKVLFGDNTTANLNIYTTSTRLTQRKNRTY